MYKSHLPTNKREKKRKHFDDILVFSSLIIALCNRAEIRCDIINMSLVSVFICALTALQRHNYLIIRDSRSKMSTHKNQYAS